VCGGKKGKIERTTYIHTTYNGIEIEKARRSNQQRNGIELEL
jgi:hypothetical protein